MIGITIIYFRYCIVPSEQCYDNKSAKFFKDVDIQRLWSSNKNTQLAFSNERKLVYRWNEILRTECKL